MDIDFNKLEPESQKAIIELVEKLGKLGSSLQQEPKPGNMGCVGDCMPPILPKPATDAITEGLLGAFKLIENVKSASYIKSETEIKIEIVINAPKNIPSAVFEVRGRGGKI